MGHGLPSARAKPSLRRRVVRCSELQRAKEKVAGQARDGQGAARSQSLTRATASSGLVKLRIFKELEKEAAQGACGRGLAVATHVPEGNPVFEEAPFLIVYKKPSEPLVHHAHRWQAYSTLATNARKEQEEDGYYKEALSSFDDFQYPSDIPGPLREVAATIASNVAEGDDDSATGRRIQPAWLEQHISGVMMRFKSNEFGFANGPDVEHQTPPDAFLASAVYAFTSRVNHSCDPTLGMVTKEGFHISKKIGFKLDQGGGMRVAYAKKPLVPGTRLSFNYADAEVLTWDVKRRREHLKESYGFVCGCERCERRRRRKARSRQYASRWKRTRDQYRQKQQRAPLRAQNTVVESCGRGGGASAECVGRLLA